MVSSWLSRHLAVCGDNPKLNTSMSDLNELSLERFKRVTKPILHTSHDMKSNMKIFWGWAQRWKRCGLTSCFGTLGWILKIRNGWSLMPKATSSTRRSSRRSNFWDLDSSTKFSRETRSQQAEWRPMTSTTSMSQVSLRCLSRAKQLSTQLKPGRTTPWRLWPKKATRTAWWCSSSKMLWSSPFRETRKSHLVSTLTLRPGNVC